MALTSGERVVLGDGDANFVPRYVVSFVAGNAMSFIRETVRKTRMARTLRPTVVSFMAGTMMSLRWDSVRETRMAKTLRPTIMLMQAAPRCHQ